MKLRAIPFLVLCAASAGAQVPLAAGITAAAVFSKPFLDDYGATPLTISRTAYASVGGVLRVPLEGSLFVQLEPAFVRKGLEGMESLYGYSYRVRGNADYVELPVVLCLSFPSGAFSPYAMIGPALGYKVAEKWDFGFASGPPPDLYERYDVSLEGGGGLEYRFAPSASAVVQARYSIGLNQINTSGSGGLRSSEVRLSAGLLFRL